MKELERYQSRAVAALREDGNPEGKGQSGFLLDWYRSEPRGVVAKPQRQVLAEFFTSMLVLSAKFKYKPVVGVPNRLYYVGGEWSLSLIAPEEWSEERRAGFAGTCILHPDMTWTFEPSALLADGNPVSDAVARFYDGFAEMLDTDLTLEEILPFCRPDALLAAPLRECAQPVGARGGKSLRSAFSYTQGHFLGAGFGSEADFAISLRHDDMAPQALFELRTGPGQCAHWRVS